MSTAEAGRARSYVDYYLTRETIRPSMIAPGVTDVRLGSSAAADGWDL